VYLDNHFNGGFLWRSIFSHRAHPLQCTLVSIWQKESWSEIKRKKRYNTSNLHDHSGNVSSSSVNGDIAFLWEWSNFDHS